MRDYEAKVWAGGIRNRINRICMCTGKASATYNDRAGQTGQTTHTLIERQDASKPENRKMQDGVKDRDV